MGMKDWFRNGICLVLMVVIALYCGAAGAESELPEITFNGIPLGSTAKDVAIYTNFALNKGDPWQEYRMPDLIKWIDGLDCQKDELPINESLFLRADASIDEVAGHSVSFATMYFIRPVCDGAISQVDDNSILYAAKYVFIDSAKEMKSIISDLRGKITELYGKPEKKGDANIWYGANQTAIFLYDRNGEAILTYAYIEAENIYQEGFVNDVEKAKLSAIDGLILHKIITPYVITVIRS